MSDGTNQAGSGILKALDCSLQVCNAAVAIMGFAGNSWSRQPSCDTLNEERRRLETLAEALRSGLEASYEALEAARDVVNQRYGRIVEFCGAVGENDLEAVLHSGRDLASAVQVALEELPASNDTLRRLGFGFAFPIESWREAQRAIREELNSLWAASVAPGKEPTAGGAAIAQKGKAAGEGDAASEATAPSAPAVLLATWREILIALGMRNNKEDRQKADRLNDTYNGPIRKTGRGRQPLVDKSKLLGWWNHLEATVQAEQDRQRDAEASVDSQYDYGRGGKVVPEISGGIKKRRKDRRP